MNNKLPLAIAQFTAFSLALIACQAKEFESGKKAPAPVPSPGADKGKGDTKQGPTDPTAPTAATNPSVLTTGQNPGSQTGQTSGYAMNQGATGVTIASDVSDSDAIRKCLNLWGSHPFKSITKANSKKIGPSVSFGGFVNLGGVNETIATAEDQLVVIDVSVNIASEVTYKMLNPKGWYCLKANFSAGSEDMLAKTNLKLECSAKITETDLNISLSTKDEKFSAGINQPQSGAQLGILVNASVGLVREKNAGGACN